MLTTAVADLEPWPADLLARPPEPAMHQVEGVHNGAAPGPTLRIHHPTGPSEVVALPVGRWHGPAPQEELDLLARARSPVLDVGCGPGRHVAALVGAGHVALGIDISSAAVAAARRRGAPAARVSVFGQVPRVGLWATAVLLDGNIGIGGDPAALLTRVHRLLAQGGTALVEVDPPGVKAGRYQAHVEHAGRVGPRFAWARVGTADISDLGFASGFVVAELWRQAGRWFARLERCDRRQPSPPRRQ